jgi:hypothetical protein
MGAHTKTISIARDLSQTYTHPNFNLSLKYYYEHSKIKALKKLVVVGSIKKTLAKRSKTTR